MNENICAISTALGVGAISIVRASGPDVIEIVNKCFDKDLTNVLSHTINYGHIIDSGEIIDEVLLMLMRAPKTYTMEDVVEINCHGGIATTNKILELLIKNGCRMALPGEFTKKAFLNGRIDLTQAESVEDLIVADSDESRKYALSRLNGNLSNKIKDMRDILVKLRATLEIDFDYPEETDNPKVTYEELKTNLINIKTMLEELVNTSKDAKIIKDGIDVGIIGRPNVGKSSILNRLLNEDKAIVTNIAGTTRDIVEGNITLDGIKLNLTDTAGIRETSDVVERIGVDKSLSIASSSDLVIFVLNNNEEISEDELNLINSINNVKEIIFINKNDLDSKINLSLIDKNIVVYGNTVDNDGLDNLKNKIKELFASSFIKNKDYNLLSNAREVGRCSAALKSINDAINGVDSLVPFEMISVDIKDAYDALGELIGDEYVDDLIDEMFKDFCLGK